MTTKNPAQNRRQIFFQFTLPVARKWDALRTGDSGLLAVPTAPAFRLPSAPQHHQVIATHSYMTQHLQERTLLALEMAQVALGGVAGWLQKAGPADPMHLGTNQTEWTQFQPLRCHGSAFCVGRHSCFPPLPRIGGQRPPHSSGHGGSCHYSPVPASSGTIFHPWFKAASAHGGCSQTAPSRVSSVTP